MKSPSKFKLIRVKNNNQGFALALSMAFGLTMIVVGTTIMMKTQSKTITSSTKKKITNVQSVTEVGIGRYQQILANNSEIATYCANAGTQAPCDSGTTWSNITADVLDPNNTSSSSACSTSTSSTTSSSTTGALTATQIQTLADTSTWQNIDDNNPNLGQYRLVSYIYQPTTDTLGTGILTVEGRLPQPSNGPMADTASRLVAEIPVHQTDGSSSSSSSGEPGLWIRWNKNADASGSVQLQTHIKDSTCPEDTDSGRVTKVKGFMTTVPPDNSTAEYRTIPGEAFPPLPAEGVTAPTGSGVYQIAKITNATGSLPQSGETAVDGVLTYHIQDTGKSIDLSGGNNLYVGTGAETVVLHLDGDLVISGGGGIHIANGSRLIMYVHGKVTLSGGSTTNAVENSGDPEDAQLYVYTPDGVTLSGGSGMKLFLFAPDSLVTMSSDSKFHGTIWANSWKGSGSVIFTQGQTDLSKTQLKDAVSTQKTQIQFSQTWRREELPSSTP